ncbi:MAG: Stp1/IreP family PP2C-type Ser/Thr phosphatase [Clostridia bacterium]
MRAYGLSNVGKVRPMNEDAYYLPKEAEAFAVIADGMGGHRAGEVASNLAIQVMSEKLHEAPTCCEEALTSAVALANRAIYEAAQADDEKYGMGTTLTCLWRGSDFVYLAHVGDSRAYLLRNRALMQLTNDHTLVNALVERGELTPSEARVHPQRNVITRALGTGRRVTPDIIRLDVKAGDVWLLCTDGLSNCASNTELAQILLDTGTWEKKLEALIELALSRGGRDNITSVLVVMEEEAQ